MQQYLCEHFRSPGHTSFTEGLYNSNGQDRPFHSNKHENYWGQTFKTLALHGLNIEESV